MTDSNMIFSPFCPYAPHPIQHDSLISRLSGPEPSYHNGRVEVITFEYADTEDEVQSQRSGLDRQLYRFSDNFSQFEEPYHQFGDHEIQKEDQLHPDLQVQPGYQVSPIEGGVIGDGFRVEMPRPLSPIGHPLSPIPYSESQYHSDNASTNDVMDVRTTSHRFSIASLPSIESFDRLSEIRRHGPGLCEREQAEIAASNKENRDDLRHSEIGYVYRPVIPPEVEISPPPPETRTTTSRMSTTLPPPMMVGLGAHPAVLEGEKGVKDAKGKRMVGEGKDGKGMKLPWLLRIFHRGGKIGR